MKKLALIVSLLLPLAAFAQSYSVDWYKISGGGGTSSGGNYSLVGTNGQADAGKSSGGNYTLEGGFLAGIGLVQTTGAPQLSIQLSGVNAVISWAADKGTGFNFEQANNVNSQASWGTSGATLSTNGNIISASVPANSGIKFYRLHKP
jgi:hypothetical protein